MELGYLISCFGIAGIMIHLLSYPFRKDSKMLQLFYEYFHIAFALMILLLVIAIGIRIQQYGLTGKRYIIVLLTVWFIALSVSRVFTRKYFSIKFAPLFLSILLILFSFGPFGITKLPIAHQIALLKTILIKNFILVKGKVTPTHTKISSETASRIKSIVEYLVVAGGDMGSMKNWFGEVQFNSIEIELEC